MIGTAAEVTPLRSVDDHEIGVGPVTMELQQAYLATVRGRIEAGATGSTSCRRATAPRRDHRHPPDPALEPVPRRARGGARARGAALRAALARAVDRPLRGGRSRSASARRTPRLSPAAPPGCTCSACSPGSGRVTRRSRRRTRSSRPRTASIYEGATPVFADIDPRTLNLDPAAVEAAITPRTKAIVAVDIFGYPCELEPLQELCERHGLTLIQDACETLGASYRGAPVGSHGPSARLRLLPEQADDDGRGRRWSPRTRRTSGGCSTSLRNQGRADGGGWLEHARLGFNYRIDDIRAALGLGQLEKLDEILRRARARRPRATRAAGRGARAEHAAAPTTTTTSARGSSTSSSSTRAATASA